jgi:hypothetical protein
MRDHSSHDAKVDQGANRARLIPPGDEPLTNFFARAGLGDIEIRRIEATARDEAELLG